MSALRSAVVAVGDELLLGDVVNGNAAWLGAALAGAGAPVVHSATVGDDSARIVTALRRALEDAEVVVVTGGLGPTTDDLTRDALAALAGVPLDRSPELVRALRERYAAYGAAMPEQVYAQADVPRGGTALPNPAGTAPGLRLEVDGGLVFALPGPPHELAAVATGSLLPEVVARSGVLSVTRTVHVAGVPESVVQERVQAAVALPPGVALSYLAGGALVRVRFTAVAATAAEAALLLDPLAEAVTAALGADAVGRDEHTLPVVVVARLRAAGATVAVAESLTGGLLGAAITAVPGASAVFRGGVLSYATDLKATLAGVPQDVLARHGAVAPETAAAMAEGVRVRAGASYGVGLTGVAGPEPQEGHPPGTLHVAVAGPGGLQRRSVRLPGDRERVRLLAVTAALDLLRRSLP